MKKFILFLIVVLVFFSLLEWKNITLSVANMRQDIGWYYGPSQEARLYDEALWIGKSGQTQQAISLLTPLLNASDLSRPADIFELYGDALYTASGKTEDILTFYHRAFEFSPSERLNTKISILSQKQGNSSSGSTSSTSGAEKVNTGDNATLRENRAQQIINADRDRSESINLITGTPEDVISRTFSLLETRATIRDW